MMNKKDLVKEISKNTELSQVDCLNCLDAITEIICKSLNKGEEVNIFGFGKFEVKKRAERRIINPQTQRPMIIKQRRVPVFKSGKVFKDAVK